MKITYVPLNPDATGFYRCLSPGRQLALNGHQVRLPFTESRNEEKNRWEWEINLDKILSRPDQPDLYCVQMRWERHWINTGIHEMRNKGAAIVVECDDNYLEQPEWNPAFYGNHPYRRDDGIIIGRKERRTKAQKRVVQSATGRRVTMSQAANQANKLNRHHGLEMMRQADAVIVSTPHLAEIYSGYNSNIKVVRNYLDWEIWENVTPQYEVERERLRIGWLGAVRYRRGDLDVIKDVIPKVMKRHPEIDFVANTEEVHDTLGVPPEQRITIGEWEFYQGMQGSTPLAEMTAVTDIGLVPLYPGGFNEGKSHLKGMEYAAAGIPFIASNTESYRYFLGGLSWKENGNWIAETPKQWEEALEFYISNDNTRRACGELNRALAKKHTIQEHWREWEQEFSDVVGDPHTQMARGAIKRGAVQKVSELKGLLDRVATMKPKVVVEVGSARGGTFWALSQVSHPEALLVSVDIPSGSPLDVRDGKDVYAGRDRERFRSFVTEKQTVVLIDGNSQLESTVQSLRDVLAGQEIDVLFIDADHRYQGVKRDYELYSPLVRKGGLIAFHDVIPQNDVRSGVHVLWNQLKKNDSSAETIVGKDNWGLGKWGGIGVLRRA